MKRTIKRGEKIMKGRFFTLILGLCLVATSAMAQDGSKIYNDNGTNYLGIPIQTKGSITVNFGDMVLSPEGSGSGTGTTINCKRKIPAVEMFKGVVNIHGINKYTQLETTRATFDYLTTMGIYNGTVSDVNFNSKGGVSNWTTTQYTPGYWGTQNAIVDMYNNNSWLLMGMGGMGGSLNGGWGSWGGYYGATQNPRIWG